MGKWRQWRAFMGAVSSLIFLVCYFFVATLPCLLIPVFSFHVVCSPLCSLSFQFCYFLRCDYWFIHCLHSFLSNPVSKWVETVFFIFDSYFLWKTSSSCFCLCEFCSPSCWVSQIATFCPLSASFSFFSFCQFSLCKFLLFFPQQAKHTHTHNTFPPTWRALYNGCRHIKKIKLSTHTHTNTHNINFFSPTWRALHNGYRNKLSTRNTHMRAFTHTHTHTHTAYTFFHQHGALCTTASGTFKLLKHTQHTHTRTLMVYTFSANLGRAAQRPSAHLNY